MPKLPTQQCYRVTLPDTGTLKNIYKMGDEKTPYYISVEGGAVFIISPSMIEVASRFPKALSIDRIGIGYVLEPCIEDNQSPANPDPHPTPLAGE